MANGASGASIVAAVVLGAAIVVASLVLKGGLDAQTEALAEVRSALADLEDAVREGDALRPAAARPSEARRGPDPSQRVEVPIGDSPVRGPAQAAVTIVEFADFQCPFCARVQPTLARIQETYGERVNLVFKHLPLRIHPRAPAAAAASEAARLQGKFWEMHDRIFSDLGDLSDERFAQYAAELGLDVERFRRDMTSQEVRQRVARDEALANRLGVSGTPAFFINGRFFSGAQPFENFQRVIDAELSEG